MIGPCDIAFAVRAVPGGDVEVMPRIGGRLLADLIEGYELGHGREPAGGYAGLRPTSPRHFRGGSTETYAAGATPVLGGGLCCRITVTDDWVVWDEFAQPARPGRDYSRFGPFGFARADYEDALGDLALALT